VIESAARCDQSWAAAGLFPPTNPPPPHKTKKNTLHHKKTPHTGGVGGGGGGGGGWGGWGGWGGGGGGRSSAQPPLPPNPPSAARPEGLLANTVEESSRSAQLFCRNRPDPQAVPAHTSNKKYGSVGGRTRQQHLHWNYSVNLRPRAFAFAPSDCSILSSSGRGPPPRKKLVLTMCRAPPRGRSVQRLAAKKQLRAVLAPR